MKLTVPKAFEILSRPGSVRVEVDRAEFKNDMVGLPLRIDDRAGRAAENLPQGLGKEPATTLVPASDPPKVIVRLSGVSEFTDNGTMRNSTVAPIAHCACDAIIRLEPVAFLKESARLVKAEVIAQDLHAPMGVRVDFIDGDVQMSVGGVRVDGGDPLVVAEADGLGDGGFYVRHLFHRGPFTRGERDNQMTGFVGL